MAEKRVIEYEAASELANDDWLLIDGVTEGTRKARANVVTAELGAQVTNLASTVSGLTQVAMGHEQSFAPDYDESASYDVGDLVMQYHGLYKCTAPTTGTWDAGKWARTEVSEQLEESGKIDDVQVNGVSVVTDKVASIDLTGMQADIDSKQADTKIGGTSILDNNKVANLDFLASYGEASGSITSFNDGAAMPLKSLKVGIEAVQDLHGYDSPWVGGAGKNKFKTDFENTTINGTTITKTSDGRVLTSGVPTSPFDFIIGHVSLPAGSYILNGCTANGGYNKYRLQVTDYPVVNNLGIDYGSGVSFTLEHDMEIAVRIQVYTGASATLEYKPMIRLATVSDATFAPYSNICPFSGWSAVNVYRTGKNLFEHNSIAVYTYDFVSNSTFEDMLNPFFMKGGQTYVLTIDSGNKLYRMRAFDKNHDIITDMNKINAVNHGTTTGLTYYPTGKFYGYDGAGADNITVFRPTEDMWFDSTVQTTASIQNMLEIGDTATTYEPYTGTTYTTTLKDGQGNPMTCYGGTLTNENGVQRLDNPYGFVDLGTLDYGYSISDSRFFNNSLDYKRPSSASDLANALCSNYMVVKLGDLTDGTICLYSNGYMYIKDSRYTDATAFKTAMSGVQLVYELATPQQIPQDSLSIATQEGMNNLWADSGEILECKYVRDNSAVINDLIARVTALENE